MLDFLWTWKVASTPLLGEVAYKGKSTWWIYKALRQLQNERYIQLLPRGKNLEQELWALTDLGFEIILMDRDDIIHYRYKPHAPAHDYLGSCLQMGDLWQFPCEKLFFTEQMLASLAPSNFPKGFKQVEGHTPDGVTILHSPLKEVIIGYEVDLNLKDLERYESTFEYYLEIKPTLVFWLVRNNWMADKIMEVATTKFGYDMRENLLPKICFVLVDEFKEKVWAAQVVDGKCKGLSIRKLHANLLQNLGKDPVNLGQTNLREIYFPRFKSPQKSKLYEKSHES